MILQTLNMIYTPVLLHSLVMVWEFLLQTFIILTVIMIIFDQDVPGNIVFVRLFAWDNKFKQNKAYRKEKTKN